MTAITTRTTTLHGRFLRGLALAPERPAFRVGGRAVSYEQAHATALGWAGTLLDALPAPPRAVGVLANKSAEAYLGTLAALYAGAAVVPLHPDFPVARNRHAITAAGVAAIITDAAGTVAAAELLGLDSTMPVLAPDGGSGRLLRPRPELALAEPRPCGPDDPAYTLFTSGSTGTPKGVTISHRNTDAYFSAVEARYDFGPDDVFSQTFDLTFDCAMMDIFAAWGAGGCAVPVPLAGYRALPEFVAEHRMTVWGSVPSAIGLVGRTGGLGPGALPGLRWSLFMGDALPDVDVLRWHRAAPNSMLENLYGPTELTIIIATHRWSPASLERAVNGIVPIGPVHPGHDYVLLDPDGTVLPAAAGDSAATVDGELCVTGPQMCAGYLDPRDDVGRFLDHDGRRWYRTGDQVRRYPDEELSYIGRADDQVQLGGWRVELAEVGHAVRACPGVRDAVAVAPVVDGEPRLFVFHTGDEVSPAELTAKLAKVLPHGMLPRQYRRLDEFPLNANGKIDRKALRYRAAEVLAGRQP